MENVKETQQEPRQERAGDGGARPYPPRDIAWQRKPAYPEDPRFKSPVVATLLSLIPGLGQVYVGYYRQGFINVLVVGSLITLLAPGPRVHGPLTPLLVFFLIFYWLYNLVDAARRASFYNQALSGIALNDFPPEFRMPEKHGHGSLVSGALLILSGLVISSYTVYGYSLEWLEKWWPMALILVGAYLVFQAVMERRRDKRI
jgi:TM2 domain-containing membrane protein YozV